MWVFTKDLKEKKLTFTDFVWDNYLPQENKDFYLELFLLFRLIAAECIMTFGVSSPLIVLKISLFCDKYLLFDLEKK